MICEKTELNRNKVKDLNLKKIVFWGDLSYLALFINPLSLHLEDNGVSFTLLTNSAVHDPVASWSNDSECRIIDIKGYSLKRLEDTITNIMPSVLILSNYKSVSNLIILMLCKTLGIKTIFIQHGIFDSKIEDLKTGSYSVTIIKYLKLLKLYFQLRKYPDYSLNGLIKILNAIYRKKNLEVPYGQIDNAIVFADHDVEFISSNLYIDKVKIHKAGYPAFNYNSEYHDFISGSESDSGMILLLQQPFISKSSKYNVEDEFKYYERIDAVCNRQDRRLIIKLHPAVDINSFASFDGFKDMVFNINRHENIKLVQHAEVILAANSTAVFYAIMLKKPIVLIPYLDIEIDYLNFEEVGVLAKNEDELSGILADNELLYSKISNYDNFIDNYIGRKNSNEHLAETLFGLL